MTNNRTLSVSDEVFAKLVENEFVEISREEYEASIHDFIKAIKVPPNWTEIASNVLGGRIFAGLGMSVIVSVDTLSKGEWAHLSVSRRSRMPSYEDLFMVKRLFLGENLPAYQVFPKSSEHRNLHNFCLHMWMPLQTDPFPDIDGSRADRIAPKLP